MKTKLLTAFFLLSLTCFCFGQGNTVRNYHSGTYISCIAIQGDTAWIATYTAGLVKQRVSTGAIMNIYTKYNSGLQSNSLDWVTIDHAGRIWVATDYEGIARFDGVNWTIYNYNNSPLPRDYIYQMAVDASNNLWIATVTYGLLKFDGTNWTAFNTSNSGINSNLVHAVKVDNNNVVWVGGYKGLSRYDGLTWTTYDQTSTGFPINSVRDICIKGSTVWLATSQGLAKYDGLNWSYWNPLNYAMPSNFLRSVNVDSNGTVWMGTIDAGAYKYNGITWTSFTPQNSGIRDNWVRNIEFSPTGVWFATTMGLIKYQNLAWTYQVFNNCNIAGDGAGPIYTDKADVKWIATYDAGLIRFDGVNWSHYDSTNSPIATNGLSGLAADGAENLWMSTNTAVNSAIFKFDKVSTWKVYSTPNLFNIYSFTVSPGGIAWIAGSDTNNDAVYSFDGTNWKNYNYTNSPLPQYFSQPTLTPDQSNHVWMADPYNITGVLEFDGITCSALNTGNWTIPTDTVYSIYNDSLHNLLWFTTDLGLAKYDGANWTVYDSTVNGYQLRYTSNLVYQNSNYWMTYGNGSLLKWDGTNGTEFSIYNSDLPANVFSISPDRKGNLWLASADVTEFNELGVSVGELNKGHVEELSVAPNPSAGVFKIKMPVVAGKVLWAEVKNAIGQTVWEKNDSFTSVNISSEPAGIYFLLVRASDGHLFHTKIIKE